MRRIGLVIVAAVMSCILALSTVASASAESTSAAAPVSAGVVSAGGAQAGIPDGGYLREPAGKYTYVCIGTDGSSYTLQSGAALNTCKGSFLQRYIGGVQVEVINLTTDGHPATNPNIDLSLACIVSYVGLGATLLGGIPSGGASWVASAATVAGVGICLAG